MRRRQSWTSLRGSWGMPNNNFQDSLIGLLPNNWEIRTVESLGKVITGTTPRTSHSEFYGGDIPFVSPADLGDKRYISRTQTTLTNEGVKQARLLPPDSILVTCIGILGKVGQAQTTLTTNQQINGFVPLSEIDASFTYWVMHLLKAQLQVKAGLQVVPIVNKSTFSRLLLPLPPLPEQRRIAEILDAADAAIRRTERVIVKLRDLKAGLLHDLLTRGLDTAGRLRDPQAHPEQFKDSPLGRVPREWEASHLSDIAKRITSGSRGWAAYYSDIGPRFLRIGNLTREHINLRLDNVVHVQPPQGSEGSRTVVQEGDLLISITADLGVIGVIPSGFGEAYVNQHIALVKVDVSKVNPRWVGMYLAGAGAGQNQFYRLNDMGAKSGLNLPTVGAVTIALPPRREQDAITNILDFHDTRIQAEQTTLAKLRQVKQGLMDDLLTGRVRV